uniref:Reverse transcriptase zinc-binding domain-containing protein n=1 Tax=Brassica oleracea TaxID=3712 RepID=A0A3P6EY65_BRAOL|nr:unnamed protein product [Brassica oleracea]
MEPEKHSKDSLDNYWHWSTHLNGHSFWTIAENASDSWAWRKLLDLRPLALQFSKTRLGNGLTASFWSDQWTPMGLKQECSRCRCYSRITLDPYTSTFSRGTWGLPVSPSCSFYSNFEEMRDHLMLSCEYIQEVWREVLLRCQPPNTMFADWSELLSWIRAASSSKLSLLRKLAVQTVIYHLWKQRNNLVRNQTYISVAAVFYGIGKDLQNIISSRRRRKHFDSLMAMWLR